MKNYLVLAFVFLAISMVLGQTPQENALTLGKKAIGLMDEGNFEASIKLLEEAKILDPDNINYQYEIAYAYYLQKDYSKAIAEITTVKTHKNVSVIVFQLLGNAYSMNGEPDKALQTYEEGMERFPNAGNFYLESGNVEYARKNYLDAMNYWETGIKVDPNYPSNYYRLAKIFLLTDELIWSIIYAELFLNLEPGTARTEEISKLLYDNYKKSYTVKSDSSGQFNLTKKGFEIVIDDNTTLENIEKGILPFEGSYASVFAIAAVGFVQDINL